MKQLNQKVAAKNNVNFLGATAIVATTRSESSTDNLLAMQTANNLAQENEIINEVNKIIFNKSLLATKIKKSI